MGAVLDRLHGTPKELGSAPLMPVVSPAPGFVPVPAGYGAQYDYAPGYGQLASCSTEYEPDWETWETESEVPGEGPRATGSPTPPNDPDPNADPSDPDEIEYSCTPTERLQQIMPQAFRYQGNAAHGTIGSLVLHVIVLAMVSSVVIEPKTYYTALEPLIIEPTKEEELKLEIPEPELTLAPPSETPHENVLASMAMAMASIQDDNPELVREDDLRVEVDPDVFDLTEVKDVAAFLTHPVARQRGHIGEEVMHVEGAVDRITHEIASRLETDPVLVVWMMDASISLVDDRQLVADRLTRVYGELGQLETYNKRSLLSAVVAYGQNVRDIVPPTADGRLVVEGIRTGVPTDETGIENVFGAVVHAITRYKPLLTVEQRRAVIVIWTDESGDDYARLDEAAAWCRRLSIPVFVVGPSAMFGREQGTHAYKNPEDGLTYQIPINRGPDALHQEHLKLPYWFGGDQFEAMHAGVGPFALTRLAIESGGAYFINDSQDDRSEFRLDVMKNYLPDYVDIPQYIQRANASPLRLAVLKAVEITHQERFQGTPRLLFEPTGRTYVTELADAQKTAALNVRVVDLALQPFGKGFENEYAKEESKRWRAWYDLTYGRLLAMYVRCNEYNWACAEMKRKGADFVDQKSNRWRFVPSTEIRFNSQNEKLAKEAIRLLTRCVEQNPGTPWAVLAQRELKDPLGFDVLEHYVAPPPPPPRRPTPPANPNPPPPPPVVNPPTKRVEQPKMIERPAPPKLPKL